ncbi:MAG: hypothetical protein HZB26_15630 [Candidatus Hydrogenedentes bacterium]|nr:hypothetical protein [Candidatus Hydrogenedentota bacterium]
MNKRIMKRVLWSAFSMPGDFPRVHHFPKCFDLQPLSRVHAFKNLFFGDWLFLVSKIFP